MQGIVCETDSRVRDEAPQAYKDLSSAPGAARESDIGASHQTTAWDPNECML